MKIWRGALVVILLTTIPALSACDLFGNSKEKERQEYERQLEYIKQVKEANEKAQEDYNRRLKEGLEQWLKAQQEWQEAYQEWQKDQIEQQQK